MREERERDYVEKKKDETDDEDRMRSKSSPEMPSVVIGEVLYSYPNKQLEKEQKTSPQIPQPGQHVQGLPQQLQMPPSHSRRAPSGSTAPPAAAAWGSNFAAAVAADEAVFFSSSAIVSVDWRLSGYGAENEQERGRKASAFSQKRYDLFFLAEAKRNVFFSRVQRNRKTS